MTVSSTTNRKTFTGNGVTVAFATSPIVFFDAGDLTVYKVVTATGVATLQTITTDYTVSGGDGSTGTVTMVTAPASTETLVIVRELDLVQEVDFVNNEATDAEVAEDALDRLTMIAQQLSARLDRAFVLSDSDISGADGELPVPEASSLIGWNSAGTALQNYATADLDSALTTAFTLTLLDDTTAAAARTTLGLGTMAVEANPLTANGSLLTRASGVLAEKTIGSDGYDLRANGVPLWLPPSLRQQIINGEIIESHASNAVTYTLKGKGGVDLSATNPCFLLFPSGTLTSGDFDIIKVTANISVTVSSGSTLGHASNIPQHSFIYAINNAGTAELAISNLPPDYPGTFLGVRKISTTAEGGAGAADSATGIYSTTARSNVTWIPLAKVLGTQTTAGTWAASPTQIDMAPFSIPTCAFSAQRSAAQAIGSGAWTKVQFNSEIHDIDGTYDAATNYRHQPNVAGLYRYMHQSSYSEQLVAGQCGHEVYKNGSSNLLRYWSAVANGAEGGHAGGEILMNGTTDYAEAFVYHSSGANKNIGGTVQTAFIGSRVGGGKS